MIFNTPCWGRFNFKRWYIVGENTSFGVRQKWVWFASYFALPFNSWSFVDLCKLPCFSVSQFPCLQNGEYDSYFSSVQLLSRIWLFATPWIAALQASLSIPTPGVYPNSCPLSQWCHAAISFSVAPFSSCPQPLPASGSFPVSQLFPWGGQSIGVSASASVLPMNTQDWSPLGWTAWISLQSKGLSRVFSNTTVQKHQFFGTQLSL